MYGDKMTFDIPTIQTQIGVLEEVKTAINTLKTNYIDYVNTQLKPNWTTDAGIRTTNELIRFAEDDIGTFIKYLEQNIANLEEAKNHTTAINEA